MRGWIVLAVWAALAPSATLPAFPYHTLPLTFENGWYIVPVVSGEDSLRFIFDTGAGISVVTESTAGRLGLAEGDRIVAQGASGSQEVRATTVPALTFAGIEVRNTRVFVLPDRHVTPTPVGGAQDPAYDGVLGADLFGAYDVYIDPLAGVVRLYAPGEAIDVDLPTALAPPIAVRRTTGTVLSHDILVNEVPLPAVVDTGARHVILNTAAAERAGVEPGARVTTPVGVGTESPDVWEAAPQRIRIGGVTFGSAPVRIADLPVFAVTGFRDQPVVLLGTPVFGGCAMLISYRDDTIRYCREPTSGPTAPATSSSRGGDPPSHGDGGSRVRKPRTPARVSGSATRAAPAYEGPRRGPIRRPVGCAAKPR